jgi:putative hydrolase of the HAD superfamily
MSNQEYIEVLERMATSLSVPPDDFNRVWFETARERNVGIIQSIEDNIIRICEQLQAHAGDVEIGWAVRIRLDFVRRTMRPRSDAVEILSWLRSKGFKIGLVSNCSCDTPVVWQDTPFAPLFDVTVFSSLAGIMKPDPRIYLLAAEQLGVQPEDCLYVGDGASQELPGAARVGMNPVLLCVPEDEHINGVYQIDTGGWDGPRVSLLTEVLALVK